MRYHPTAQPQWKELRCPNPIERLFAEGQEPQAPVVLPRKRSQTRFGKEPFKDLSSFQEVLQAIGGRIHEGRPLEPVLLEGVDGRKLVHVVPEVPEVLLHHLQGFHSHDVGKGHFVTKPLSQIHGFAGTFKFERLLVSPEQVPTVEDFERKADTERLRFRELRELLRRRNLRPEVEDLASEVILLYHPL